MVNVPLGDTDDELSNQAAENFEEDDLKIFEMIEKQCLELQEKQ